MIITTPLAASAATHASSDIPSVPPATSQRTSPLTPLASPAPTSAITAEEAQQQTLETMVAIRTLHDSAEYRTYLHPRLTAWVAEKQSTAVSSPTTPPQKCWISWPTTSWRAGMRQGGGEGWNQSSSSVQYDM
jgi:hypothetical protein